MAKEKKEKDSSPISTMAEVLASQNREPLFVGHTTCLSLLSRLKNQDRLPNAMIFSGPEGIGKKTLACLFIAHNFCDAPNEILKTCHACSACLKLKRDNHPDYIFLEPDGRTLKIEQIRSMQKHLHFHSFQGGRRWVLINDAQCLTEQAQNALLRILEEPPHDTHFILITSVLDKLLLTLRSRCQFIRFSPLSPSETFQVLKKLQFNEEKIHAFLPLANGSPGKISEWVDDEILEIRNGIFQALQALATKNSPEKHTWAVLFLSQTLSRYKSQAPVFLQIILSIFRDWTFFRLGAPTQDLHNQDKVDLFANLDTVAIDALIKNFRLISKLDYDFRINSNLELTYNRVFQDVVRIFHE